MRTMILTAVVLAVGAVSSRAEAQVAYAYSAGAYPIYYYNNRGLSGYPAQGYYGGFTTPGFYGGTPVQSQPAPSYLSPIVQPAYGFAPTAGYMPPGYGYPVPAGSSLYGGGYGGSSAYGGMARYTSYGYRRYGAGRTFGSSIPRIYSIYQPRPGGLFDR